MTYIGIDPGLSGCMVAIDENKHIINYRDIEKIGDRIDINEIVKWFNQFDKQDCIVYCENPHVHAGDSIKTCYAAFCYGRSVATVQTIPQVLGFTTELLTPMTWKAYFGLVDKSSTYEQRKQKSVDLAITLFPDQQSIFVEEKQQGRVIRTINHHDRAEAGLIAIYGLETHITNTKKSH